MKSKTISNVLRIKIVKFYQFVYTSTIHHSCTKCIFEIIIMARLYQMNDILFCECISSLKNHFVYYTRIM